MTLSQAPASLQAAVHRTLGPASATNPFQTAKLTASDAASGDFFGESVAISGSTAIVGAYNKGSSTGAAYVFVRSGSTWSQQTKLTASDGAAGDYFGASVALWGNTAVIGAIGKKSFTGTAYVFVRSGSSWSQQAELSAYDSAVDDQFGYSVAISGGVIVVGAPYKSSSTGAAYVFQLSGATWSQQAKLTASDAAAGDRFGGAVAIYGLTAIVGSQYNNNSAGAAYVFVRAGTTWPQQAKLTAGDGADLGFGISVSLYGSTAVVGAGGTVYQTGAAYVFVRSGATWSQQAKLTAADGAAGDYFGRSVAIYGTRVVVGTPTKYANVGAAYVFTRSGTTWTEEAELKCSDATGGDTFGWSVGTDGASVVVGAEQQNGTTGAAYVFVPPAQQAKLTASDTAAGDDFGMSVAVSGSLAVVGAPYKNSGTGAAYVFVRSGTTWSQQAKLTASDVTAGDYFGASVAISGSTAVVGAYGHNSQTGAAYVFVGSGTTWSQQAKLTASDAAANDYLGVSVAISGSTAVVGAYTKNSNTGAAYVFVRSGSVWSQQTKLTASDAAAGDYFGRSVAISGSTAVVGEDGQNSNTGAAYVFVRSGTTWSQQAKLTASDAAANDYLGISVAISGSTAVVGADGQNSNTGAAYVFVRSGTTWSQQAKLTASDVTAGDGFGASVAISGSTAVVGAYGHNSQTGAAYVFVGSGTTWSQQAKLTASDAAAGDGFGISVAIDRTTALIGAYNQNSSAGAACVFTNV